MIWRDNRDVKARQLIGLSCYIVFMYLVKNTPTTPVVT